MVRVDGEDKGADSGHGSGQDRPERRALTVVMQI